MIATYLVQMLTLTGVGFFFATSPSSDTTQIVVGYTLLFVVAVSAIVLGVVFDDYKNRK